MSFFCASSRGCGGYRGTLTFTLNDAAKQQERSLFGLGFLHHRSMSRSLNFICSEEDSNTMRPNTSIPFSQESTDDLLRTLTLETPQNPVFRPVTWVTESVQAPNIHDRAQLVQADGGRRAWLFVVGAVLVEGLLWGESCDWVKELLLIAIGFPLSFGIFQTFYQSHPPFENNNLIPVVGTLCTACSPLNTECELTSTPGNLLYAATTSRTSHYSVSSIPTAFDLGRLDCLHCCIGGKQFCYEALAFDVDSRSIVRHRVYLDVLSNLEYDERVVHRKTRPCLWNHVSAVLLCASTSFYGDHFPL